MNEFSSREIMTLFWLAVALMFILWKNDIRESIVDVLKAFTNRHILILMGLMFLYITAMVYGLYRIKLWNYGLLKNTVYWSISGAALAVFRSNKAIEDSDYFRKAFKDSIGLVVVLEFVLNFYDFGLLFEFITIPIMAIVGAMIGYLDVKNEHKEVQRLLWILLFIYLAIVTTVTVQNILADYQTLVKNSAILEFLQPPLMTILFIPFLYFLVIFFAYERAFVRIDQILKPKLVSSAKMNALRQFGLDRLTMMRWVSTLMAKDIRNIDELVQSLETIKRAKEAEKSPEHVPYEDGWSPYAAKEYLSNQGIQPGYYNPSFDGSWFAYSTHFPIDGEDSILGNSVEYSFKGTERFARKIKLTLEINNRKTSTEAHEEYAVYCGILTYQALSAELHNNFLLSIKRGKNIEVKVNGSKVSLTRHDWAGDRLRAYELHFEIVHPKYREMTVVEK